jgi:hypothetical protein
LCDLETPKIGKVLDSINEMMNSMEREWLCSSSSFTYAKH